MTNRWSFLDKKMISCNTISLRVFLLCSFNLHIMIDTYELYLTPQTWILRKNPRFVQIPNSKLYTDPKITNRQSFLDQKITSCNTIILRVFLLCPFNLPIMIDPYQPYLTLQAWILKKNPRFVQSPNSKPEKTPK